jgi:hypothetical protein
MHENENATMAVVLSAVFPIATNFP